MKQTCLRLIKVLMMVLLISPLLTSNAFANTTITVEKPVHVTTAEGSDVVLDAGDYTLDSAQEWLRITPSGGDAVDALLLEAHLGNHEESLKAPLALSATGVEADSHHLVLLLPDGKSFEATGTYSGIRSRGRLSRLSVKQLRALMASKQRTKRTEFVTPSFGGSGGNHSYNLDCGNGAVLVGATYKAGSWLDAIGIICQRVNPRTGALEDDFTRGPVGGRGGRAFNRRCNEGNVAQGARARTGSFMNALSIFCSPWDPTRKTPAFSRNDDCARADGERCIVAGSRGGGRLEGNFFCPRGKVGKALRGRRGIYIDSMKFVCDFWDK